MLFRSTGFAGKASDGLAFSDLGYDFQGGNYAGAELSANFNKLNVAGGYVNFKDIANGGDDAIGEGADDAIWYVGADYAFDGNVALSAMYLKGDASYQDVDASKVLGYDYDDDGWTVGLTYKGAEASEVGSWGLFANYYDQGFGTYLAHTTDANTFAGTGFKGYGVGANYTFAKNIVGTVAYYDTESKLDSDLNDERVWADVTFTF